VTLLTLGAIIRDTNNNTEALRQQAGQLLPENEKLQDKIDNLGTVDSVKQIATEEGGLVDPGTVFFTPENP
jgi:cell division protein FtsB